MKKYVLSGAITFVTAPFVFDILKEFIRIISGTRVGIVISSDIIYFIGGIVYTAFSYIVFLEIETYLKYKDQTKQKNENTQEGEVK